MIAGNIYGVVLNDLDERARLGATLEDKPYNAAPKAPVVFQKPLSSIARGPLRLPVGGLVAATTVALLIARDAAAVSPGDVAPCVGAAALAIDLYTPNPSYYRPTVANRNSDGRLVLGDFAAPVVPDRITLSLDGQTLHEWSTGRLVRGVAELISDLSQYMTLLAGDVLLIGLPGDAPVIKAGGRIAVYADGLPPIETETMGEAA